MAGQRSARELELLREEATELLNLASRAMLGGRTVESVWLDGEQHWQAFLSPPKRLLPLKGVFKAHVGALMALTN